MSTIRGWIYYLVLAITLIPLAVVLIVSYPFSSVSYRYRLAVSWARFMLRMGEVLCGMRYEFKGTENFPTDGTSVLVLSKHQSAWDIFALASLIPHQASFVYKKARTAPGAKTHYKSGGARFAVATGTPIIPIALNSGECWPRNSISKKPGLITVSVGPMIETKDRTFDAVQADLVNWIEGEMHNISPKLYGNKVTSEFADACQK